MSYPILKTIKTRFINIFYSATILVLLVLSNNSTSYALANDEKLWQFKVYLNDDEIGFHNFSLIDKDNHQEIRTNASFDVKFLFFNAYSYRHENIEHWQDKCLTSIDASTDDNGDLFNVKGNTASETLIVNTTKNELQQNDKYDSCIKTFAYWDPDFLEEKTLLNSQTGEMVDVESEFIALEKFRVGEKQIEARRYRLTGEDLKIEIWYTKDGHWLGLESETENGHLIRYILNSSSY